MSLFYLIFFFQGIRLAGNTDSASEYISVGITFGLVQLLQPTDHSWCLFEFESRLYQFNEKKFLHFICHPIFATFVPHIIYIFCF
jgi:hypothetical protein